MNIMPLEVILPLYFLCPALGNTNLVALTSVTLFFCGV
jgi:hypothetical protein